jgi:hypothetical protein
LVQCGAALTSSGGYSGQHGDNGCPSWGMPWLIWRSKHSSNTGTRDHGPKSLCLEGWCLEARNQSHWPVRPPSPKKPARASHSSVILQLSARSLCSPRARDKTKVTRGRPFFGLGSACGRLWLMGLSLGCLGLSWVCLGPVLPWDSTQIASAGPQDGSRSSKDASRWAQQGSRLAQDRFEHESWLRSWDSLGSS